MKIYDYKGKANVVGPMIKLACQKQKMSQDTLAAKLQLEGIEVSQKVISRIEKQERFVTDYELLAFSKILNIDLYQLLKSVEVD